jgi:hypothetical protein
MDSLALALKADSNGDIPGDSKILLSMILIIME